MYRRFLPLLRLLAAVPLATIVLSLAAASPAHAQVARDMIDLSQAKVYNSPADIANWPITHAITAVHMKPSIAGGNGISFESTALSAWPDYTPPGWSGPLQYTVWAVVKVNGVWCTSGFIQMWRGRAGTGAGIVVNNDFSRNWAYDSRWGPMAGYQPQVGEQMGFFLTAGNARGVTTVTSVRERTNVVAISVPANDTGDFTFPSSSITRTFLVGDVNNDGQPDLISQSVDGTVNLAINSNGTFNLLQSPYNGVVNGWRIVGLADFNGDGRKDLLWQSAAGTLALWLNQGGNPPTTVFLTTAPTSWVVVAVADLNRDGSPDIIWQSTSGQVIGWLMNGMTKAGEVWLWNSAINWRVVGAGDFNHDGYPDLLWQNASGAVYLWLMQGTTNVSAMPIVTGPSAWSVIGVGDLNGDGSADILWGNPAGEVAVWMMSGTVNSQVRFLQSIATGWQLITP
jgi:hypothetical protein